MTLITGILVLDLFGQMAPGVQVERALLAEGLPAHSAHVRAALLAAAAAAAAARGPRRRVAQSVALQQPLLREALPAFVAPASQNE